MTVNANYSYLHDPALITQVCYKSKNKINLTPICRI
ncbi:hypothetical protein Cassandra_0389 [Pseudomonas phage Cassandra]|nr:hypothetical protein Cassandra_0389 [Pseudomonas phage Cassandra]